jgi:micrococcal nuclease
VAGLLGMVLAGLGATQVCAGTPSCLSGDEILRTHVARVEEHASFVLTDGRVVKAESVLLPAGDKYNAPEQFHRDAFATMQELLRGQTVSLQMRQPKLDRYRRLRAQIVVEDRSGKRLWLQQEMLRRGLARVSILPDRRECARELYAAEAAARQSRTGLWSSVVYAVRIPESIKWRDLGTFQIVEGKVANAAVRGSRAYLNFGQDWRKDFTVTISPEDMKSFRAAGIDPQTYAGKTLRVRGWIDRLNGFEIEAEAPEQIEVVQP